MPSNWLLAGESRNLGFGTTPAHVPRVRNVFPASAWGGTFASNGAHPGWRNGWRNSSTRIYLFCLLICFAVSKMMLAGMGKKLNPHAQALGALGGKARAKNLTDAEIAGIASKGGKARAAKLSAAERSRIAKLAVAARERKRSKRTGGN